MTDTDTDLITFAKSHGAVRTRRIGGLLYVYLWARDISAFRRAATEAGFSTLIQTRGGSFNHHRLTLHRAD